MHYCWGRMGQPGEPIELYPSQHTTSHCIHHGWWWRLSWLPVGIPVGRKACSVAWKSTRWFEPNRKCWKTGRRRGHGPGCFAAMPLDFVSRTRSKHVNMKGSHFRNRDDDDPRDLYWKNNHTVSTSHEWGTLLGKFPAIPPITEFVKNKTPYSICLLPNSPQHEENGKTKPNFS